jgi:NADH-quinone oxidoreductase subunit B
VDVPNENKFIIEYVVSSYGVKDLMPVLLSIITEIPRDNPRHPSLAKHWPSADYMEREMHEFFGVWFEDNPWMGRNFLLSPDTPEYPLRKDFKLPRETYVLRGDSR